MVFGNCLTNSKTSRSIPDRKSHVDVIHTQPVTLGEATMPWPLFSERLSANRIESDKEQGNLGLPYPSRYLSMTIDQSLLTAPSMPRDSMSSISNLMVSTKMNKISTPNDFPNKTIN